MALKGIICVFLVISCMASSQSDMMYTTVQRNESNVIDPIEMMEHAKVVLHPPKNITFYMIMSTEAIIGWQPPDVYPARDVNTSLIDPPFNATMVWLNHTYPQKAPSEGNAASEPGSSDTSTSSGSGKDEVIAAPPLPKTRDEICHSLEYFANYTVGVNYSNKALNDYIPQLITLKQVYVAMNVTADIVSKEIVPFAQGCVREYRVFYQENQSDLIMERVNATEQPEVHLKSLTPSTNYTIFVAAVFVSNRTLNSSKAYFTTAADQAEEFTCTCDWHGTVENRLCNASSLTKPCECRKNYQGLFCEQCAPGYYRTAPYFPCHRCPCASHATRDSTCRFKESFLVCSQCEAGYTGNICHMCAYGYYRHHKYCVPCNCNNNHNRSKPFMCDVITGACHCVHNASGMNCEFCHTGYVGDALLFKNCTLEDSALAMFKVLPQGVVAGICVGIILLLSFIVGCVIYWRMRKVPTQRPFWTVELKDDHEGINFNTVPNEDFQIVDPKVTMDDMDFYEQQGGSAPFRGGGSGGSGQKYSRLQETV